MEAEFKQTQPILKSSDEQRYTLAPFLVPDKPDVQNDRITAEEIEKSIRSVPLSQKLMDVYHDEVNTKVGTPVELYALPVDSVFVVKSVDEATQKLLDELEGLQEKLSKCSGVKVLPKGTAMLGTVWEEKPWADIKKGKLTGLSVQGLGNRIEVTP